ncbi:MAG: hypothetical protein GY705_11480 [Bacteroidetes bacterium]|nr:hypothetical protein [Bacteroidota bacterium]
MLRKLLHRKKIQYFIIALMVTGTSLMIFTPDHLLFKWGANYAFQLALVYLFTGVLFLFIHVRTLIFASFLCSGTIVYFLHHTTDSKIEYPEVTQGETIFTVSHFDLAKNRQNIDNTLHMMISTNADLLSVHEIAPAFDSLINNTLSEYYPYSGTISASRMRIYSKNPFDLLDTFHCSGNPNFIGCFRVEDYDEDIYFINSNILPASDNVAYARLKNHLFTIANQSFKLNAPLIVFGGFNAVPWSSEIRKFKKAAELKDSRRGATPTLPYRLPTILDIPLDHIFYSNHFKCTGYETMSENYSNRIGIMGTFQFKLSANDFNHQKKIEKF